MQHAWYYTRERINLFYTREGRGCLCTSSKKAYCQKKYGVLPEFKSGLHLGKVTVAEVGEIKKELAFHGDAINTAARIQGKCNDLKKSLLVSEPVKTNLEDKGLFYFESPGKVFLKGKMTGVELAGAVKKVEPEAPIIL